MAGTDITLKVDPSVLTAKAGEMDSAKGKILQYMEDAKAEINGLPGFWQGAAADEFQNRFKQIYDDIDNLLAVASEHISDIREIAEIYTAAETAARSAAEGLPVDGVTR